MKAEWYCPALEGGRCEPAMDGQTRGEAVLEESQLWEGTRETQGVTRVCAGAERGGQRPSVRLWLSVTRKSEPEP